MKKLPTVEIQAGSEIETTPDIAAEWIAGGYAIPMAAEPERAVIEPPEKRTSPKPAAKRK